MKVMSAFGTRPEAIKMIPVIKSLEAAGIEQIVCVTAQHRQMLDSVLEFFSVIPDVDLNVMQENQTLTSLTIRILSAMDQVLKEHKPDRILVHGDTTTTMATALAAFYHHIPVGHVEAGLRSGDLHAPFPEELNRIVADAISSHHYVPTQQTKEVLHREGRPEEGIFLTGNTVVDVLLMTVERLNTDRALRESIDARFDMLDRNRRLVLVTGHRRESFGEGFRNICGALRDIANRSDVELVYPVHLNPNVRTPVNEMLTALRNVHLIEPVDYPSFVHLMQRSHLILTDSGGIQEEAPSIDKPVLVMREVTERKEAVDTGAVRLVGTSRENITKNANQVLDHDEQWDQMAAAENPYGDGKAGSRIASILAGKGNVPLA